MSLVSTDRSVRSLLRQGVEQLRAAQVPSFTLGAELLLLHVTGRDRTWLYAHPEEVLPPETVEEYFALLRRRALGEPTQHLTGKQEFWGLEFEVTPEVLIPRPETEHLIEVALDRLAVRELRAGRPVRLQGEDITIVDIGTGSGCIAITLAKELPAATVYATDISNAALEVAKRNAARHGLSDRIQFLESDLLEGFSSLTTSRSPSLSSVEGPLLFDLVICNPPYIGLRESESLPIEVRHHEPHAALYGGEEGYELYGAIIPQAAHYLKPGGLLILELGHNSLPAVQPLLDASTWCNVGVTDDLAGIPRVLSAQRT
ncbi:MAG TPA: peptide chain release factor N(5)-glutamine methyltransferase [Candidatus Sulfotelmatobacter sp.]|nr:peptide chain release factor N(5)-glutamine methyltransferase [Candidatus Sulfotelmatobacter sp.]